MTTFDDDLIVLEGPPDMGVRRVPIAETGHYWPPPPKIYLDGIMWERSEMSPLTPSDRDGARAAVYRPIVIDPDRPCGHADMEATVEVARLTPEEGAPVEGYSAEVRVRCIECGEKFRWIGLEPGMSPARPMCNIDQTVMVAPLRPASSDDDFGMGLPGFRMNMWVAGDPADE